MIDSNMWICYFDEGLEEHKYVKEQIREVIMGEEGILTNTMVVKGVEEIMTHDGAFKKLRSKIDEIDNFSVIDSVPEKNELVNRGET